MRRPLSTPVLTFSLLGLVACGEQIDAARQAAEIAKAAAQTAKDQVENAKQANEAAEAAAKKAEAELPPGTSPEAAKQAIDKAKAEAAMQAMGAAQGPIANWRDLATYLPDAIGGFEAEGELKGKTTDMGGLAVSQVERRYVSGERRAKVALVDTHFAAQMRMPFEMAMMVSEDSSEGYKKGVKVDGQSAIVEWRATSKRSKAMVLVGGRYMLEISVQDATSDTDARDLAAAMELGKLAAFVPSEGE